MSKVIICTDDLQDYDLLRQLIRQYFEGKNMEVQVDLCTCWAELAGILKYEERDVVVIDLDGVAGIDTAVNANPMARRLIWISDLDFALQAFRLCVTYFFMKPITYMKMERALERCMENEQEGTWVQ